MEYKYNRKQYKKSLGILIIQDIEPLNETCDFFKEISHGYYFLIEQRIIVIKLKKRSFR